MKRIIKLTESDLEIIVRKVLIEQSSITATSGVGIPGTRKDDIRWNTKAVSSFESSFLKNLSNLEKEFSCIPKVSMSPYHNKRANEVSGDVRKDILRAIYFIRMNKSKILSTFKVDENVLSFLFKLAIAAMDQQTGIGSNYQPQEEIGRNIAKFDSVVSNFLSFLSNTVGGKDVYVKPGMTVAQKWKGRGGRNYKEASIGPYQMQQSNYAKATGTHQITNSKSGDVDRLYNDFTSATLAVMEYFLQNYRKIKNLNNFSGPSINYKGEKIPNMTGDYNWDVSLASYSFPFSGLLTKKYCKTEDSNWPAPCDNAPEYKPSQDTINRRSSFRVPHPIKPSLKVFEKDVIKNYFPKLAVGSDTSEEYVQYFFDYANKLSCIKF